MFSGDKPLGLFADKLPHNLKCVNEVFGAIAELFKHAGISNYERLPDQIEEKAQFAKLFRLLCGFVNASRLQGFTWETKTYTYTDEGGNSASITVELDEATFGILMLRYKELFGPGGVTPPPDTPFDLDGSLTEIDTGKIDYDYMNTRFVKFLVALTNGNPDEIESVRAELHSTFASLTSEEQKYAQIFLADLESGKITIEDGKLFKDYVSEYMKRAKDDLIHRISVALGIDESKLREFKQSKITEADIDKFGRLTALKASADITKAKAYFDSKDGIAYPIPRVRQKLDKVLRDYIINDVLPEV